MTTPLTKPTEIELWNPSASFRQTKDAPVFRVSFEVTEDLWQAFKAPQPGLRLRGFLWIADDDESDVEAVEQAKEKSKKEAKPKGEFGPYWQSMFKRGFDQSAEIREVLGVEAAQVKEKLHSVFEVDSLTFVSPERFESWAEQHSLHNLITMSRQVSAEIGERA